jgi:hypothetical protein
MTTSTAAATVRTQVRVVSRLSSVVPRAVSNPDKAQQLRDLGITVTRTVPTGVHTTPSNLRYLHAKVQHTHHTITLTPVPSLAG